MKERGRKVVEKWTIGTLSRWRDAVEWWKGGREGKNAKVEYRRGRKVEIAVKIEVEECRSEIKKSGVLQWSTGGETWSYKNTGG